jgi:hypothetical protein
VVEAEAALGIGDVLAHDAGEEGGHEPVDEAAEAGHGGDVAHAVADEDGAVGAFVGLQEGGDVGGGVLAVGVEGDGEIVAVFAGVVEAGLEGGALALVVDVLEDGGAGFGGDLGGVVGGAVVDDDHVGAVVEDFADDGADVLLLLVGGDEDAGFQGGLGHGSGGGSVGVLAVEEGLDEDLEIEGERPVFEVVEIVLDAVLDGGVAAEAVDLGPAGHAGAGDVAGHVVADVVLELLDEVGAFGAGADEGHVALDETFQNWGSSSRFHLRRNSPMRVRRGSSGVAQTGPVAASASTGMVRSL